MAAPYEAQVDSNSNCSQLLTTADLLAFKDSIRVIYETCVKLSKGAEKNGNQPDCTNPNALFDILMMLASELTSKMAPAGGATALQPPTIVPAVEGDGESAGLKIKEDNTTDSGVSDDDDEFSDAEEAEEEDEETSSSYSEDDESDPESYECSQDEEADPGEESDN